MLVLNRRTGESLFIGDRKGRTVRLGIDAPRNVLILREELKK